MSQSYNSQEVRDAAIDSLQRLQDIVGGHFPWCPSTTPFDKLRMQLRMHADYLQPIKQPCTCGMDLMRQAKARLDNERFEEFSLWADALGLD